MRSVLLATAYSMPFGSLNVQPGHQWVYCMYISMDLIHVDNNWSLADNVELIWNFSLENNSSDLINRKYFNHSKINYIDKCVETSMNYWVVVRRMELEIQWGTVCAVYLVPGLFYTYSYPFPLFCPSLYQRYVSSSPHGKNLFLSLVIGSDILSEMPVLLAWASLVYQLGELHPSHRTSQLGG